MKTKIILIGGFLGVGKTTTIRKLAQILLSQGKSVGLISNDQAENLVDTFLMSKESPTIEVAGSCFCCNFNGFIDAAKSLAKAGAEIILAEPVGSCTDLASTILRPLKKFNKEFDVAPACILADISRLEDSIFAKETLLDKDASYIISKQLEEADAIALSRADLYEKKSLTACAKKLEKLFKGKKIFRISAVTNEGLGEILDFAMTEKSSGTVKMDVDYDRYADGEAALGWLNLAGSLSVKKGAKVNVKSYLKSLINVIKKELKKNSCPVGHIKSVAFYNDKSYTANLTSLNSEIILNSEEYPEDEVSFIFNARAQIKASMLEKIVKSAIKNLEAGGVKGKIIDIKSLTPGRPNPTHRL